MKRYIKIFLIVIWMLVIFNFSNQKKDESNYSSDVTMSKIITILENITGNKFSDSEIQKIYQYGIKPLRKSAHFFVYFVLGILVYNLIFDINYKNKILLSLLICMLYSCSDEIHQLFVYGRSGSVKDVFIDTIGSILGILLLKNIYGGKNEKNRQRLS